MDEEEVAEVLNKEDELAENSWEDYEKTFQSQKNRTKALDSALSLASLKENGGKAVFPVLFDAEKIYMFLQGKEYKDIAP